MSVVIWLGILPVYFTTMPTFFALESNVREVPKSLIIAVKLKRSHLILKPSFFISELSSMSQTFAYKISALN